MFVSIITYLIELLIYTHMIVNLRKNYNQNNIINIITGYYYLFYGVGSAVGVYLVCSCVVHYDVISILFNVMKMRYEKHPKIIQLNQIMTQYKIDQIEHGVYVIGNVVRNAISGILLKFLIKICDPEIVHILTTHKSQQAQIQTINPLPSCMQTLTQEEEIAQLDSEMLKLNESLDKLFSLGTTAILQKTMNDTDGGRETSKTFMQEFGKLFSSSPNISQTKKTN